ncbi:hypothetical protein [Chryseobacterium sp. 22543]|uniref:hypothetical protein n=1 Tax=Chryseobacterium sp. 22543 TaxID=3453940 RepID=UPI003F842CF4
MYYNHNLRTDLQEWKNRLIRADFNQFSNQLKYFFDSIESNKVLKALLYEINTLYRFTDEYFKSLHDTRKYFDLEFENSGHQAAYSYQLGKYFFKEIKGFSLHKYAYFSSNPKDRREAIVENIVSPIIYYFHDKLDKSNSIIYLLEKYKRRIEWFTKSNLTNKYKNAQKEFEDILEEDLRLFLFDQGIDYPFSTPKSASGRTDIVGALDTEDPLIIEIKILDKEKGYGLNRIKSGFHQIVKYTEDYSKDVGYLVLYNFDKIRYDFKFNESNNIFPPKLIFNNKVYYFIVIDMYDSETASKLGEIKRTEITEESIIK